MRIEGADVAATAYRKMSALIDAKLYADMETVAGTIAREYQTGVARRSGQTAAGVSHEVRQTLTGVEAEVGNTHIDGLWHEYGGARSDPNPALQAAVVANTPKWIDRVEQRRREL